MSVTSQNAVIWLRAALLAGFGWLGIAFATAAEAAWRPFDIPAGPATATLKVFSAQAGGSLLYSVDAVAGVSTRAVKGELSAPEALSQMLEGTPLVGRRDAATGALSVTRRVGTEPSAPNGPVHSDNPATMGPRVPAKELVELSPFNVNAARDRGFVAASALAGGRLSTDLKDTPAAYSVLTRDFIDALNLTNLTAAQQWTTGFNEIEDDGRQNQFGDGERGRRTFRGVASNQQQIEFFPAYYDYDSYNLERFDFARGPNSILFGSGSIGGTANGLFKRPLTTKRLYEVRAALSSWDSYRATVDINQPLARDLAARLNTLWEDTNSWRDYEYVKKKAVTLALGARPWRDGSLRVTFDKGEFHRNASLTGVGDRVSGWDGVTTFTGPILATPVNANAAGVGIYGNATWVYTPGIANGAIVNVARQAFTMGGNANAAVPIGGQLVAGPLANFAEAPLLGTLGRPAEAFGKALAGAPKFFLPGRTFTTSQGADTWVNAYDNLVVAFDQQIGSHVFLGASANYSYGFIRTDFSVVRGLNNVQIDLNRLLPTGEPNPYFLTPYMQSTRDFDTVRRRSQNYRVNAAVVYDDTRFGSYRVNLEAGYNGANFSRVKYRFMLEDPAVAPRDWINELTQVRYYWGTSRDFPPPRVVTAINPVTGVTRTVPSNLDIDVGRQNDTMSIDDRFGYAQAALGAKYFQGRLSILGALRRDDYDSRTFLMLHRGDLPPEFNGKNVFFRPAAPDDYFTLTYIPKDANGNPTGPRTEAAVRPRNGIFRLPQYANDRFRDDYSIPKIKGSVDTRSAGGVLHVHDKVSVFGNYAQTWLPPSGELRIDGQRFIPSISDGWDAGLRFNLLDDRLAFTATRYGSKQDNIAKGTGTNGGLANALGNLFNSIANTNVLGDTTSTGVNRRGLASVPGNYFDTAGRKTRGYEFELTANVTPAWRISANYALQNAAEVDSYADTRRYIAANDSVFRAILTDAGAAFSGGLAVVPANLDPLQSPDAANAVASYNQMKDIAQNLTAAEQKVARLVEATGNFFTDYTIQDGALKDLRLGIGVNHRGHEVIGYRGGDTIRTGPTTTADDPAVDATTPVYRQPYQLWTGVIGYTMKVRPRIRLRLDLQVSNLFNEDMFLYYSTAQRPPGGDVNNPARVATPAQYSYLVPRSYTLTVTVSF